MPDKDMYLSSEFNTPMMQQYVELKKKYSDCILLFRLGDFYEMFMDDAKLGSAVLDITLTSRDRGKDGRIPMCGVPYHALDAYLPKLVKAGHKVAICEQIGDPKNPKFVQPGDTKGPKLVERDVVRIVTPGTLLDEVSLSGKDNNYIIAVDIMDTKFGLALADLSTGFFYTVEYPIKEISQILTNELSKFNPSECVLSSNLYNDPALLKILKSHKNLNIFPYMDWEIHTRRAKTTLLDHFKIHDLDAFGIGDQSLGQKAAAGLLGYLKYTQKGNIAHIKRIQTSQEADYVSLDRSTIINLELFSTIRDGLRKGSLLNYLDKTNTAMGGRLLKTWLLKPLKNKKEIESRFDAVSEFQKLRKERAKIIQGLTDLTDIERLISRLSVGLGNPRDLVNLKNSLIQVGKIKDTLSAFDSSVLKESSKLISKNVLGLIDFIKESIVELPPLDLRSGGFINTGVNKDLDLLRKEVKSSKDFVLRLEQKEKERTGINSLKVKFNQVFGYYIEVSKSNLHAVPKEYMRKQTLVNAERFITPQLKEHEEIILNAEEKINEIEYKLFLDIVKEILEKTSAIQDASRAVAQIDCLISFSLLAESENLTRPQIVKDGSIEIKDGRHPVVAQVLPKGEFVSNDTLLNSTDHQLLIITGPNMAGKSVYMRQTALIVLMAQIGCFVPAKSAKLSLVDKVFVRSGAADFITGGLSTFMVEMVETAYILNNATSDSLIVMDEIGRGTSTYDGISIAWSVAEFIVSNSDIKPKTLFATHYHELQKLEDLYPKQIRNYQVAIESNGDIPVFLHKVKKGGAEHSFGIQVAQLAGVPIEVCQRAIEVLSELKQRAGYVHQETVVTNITSIEATLVKPDYLDMFTDKLKTLDISRITPLEALNILAELKQDWDRQ